MKYEIINLEKKIVRGILKETTNINGQCTKDIGEVWQKFCTEEVYENINPRKNNKTIGLYTDYQGDFTKPYNFMACCEILNSSNLSDNFVEKIIREGRYAKFVINGDVIKAVGKFWNELWNMDLDRAYTCDFEEYQNNTEDMSNQEIHIYISLK
ncbi:GyrI-like domain-containing protein [Clostridium frigidicarnis]|uniref:Predicted transcriptional regulator YdeE, contains AraC-type DNA-binding domain n=1 Tax=Clostridium frigidicarnis TaxID=84698 RepID=A0A1I0YJD2_9CLOT|nr:GyrI-like domain-containing protein [Clostridium frigidicarnis]SFB13479.1 Predicted transcriptional regulator YdeE, contains AraC-type DNA-binding domain [Clostridium frigidicarnis]